MVRRLEGAEDGQRESRMLCIVPARQRVRPELSIGLGMERRGEMEEKSRRLSLLLVVDVGRSQGEGIGQI